MESNKYDVYGVNFVPAFSERSHSSKPMYIESEKNRQSCGCDLHGRDMRERDMRHENIREPDMRCKDMHDYDRGEQVLGMSYVPMQKSIEPFYCPEEALERGTMFKKLDLPWEGVLYCDDK